jgi:hypothetical protein
MSIECTTSANSTVTCVYSAVVTAGVIGVPRLLQNLESGGSSTPHTPHNKPVDVAHRDRHPPQYRVTAGRDYCDRSLRLWASSIGGNWGTRSRDL